MYTVQVWTEHYWWIADDKSGEWRAVYRDKEKRKLKTFQSKDKAIHFMTTMNPYCNRKNKRRILKDNKIIWEG